jgi:hypothetical protein
MVPPAIQRAVWENYRVGQCDDQKPSKPYCLAAKLAVTTVAALEGIVPDTKLYDFYLERGIAQ